MKVIIHKLRYGIGALEEKNFRILFTVRTISSIGDRISPIALAFAILQLTGSETQLGIVMASRTVAMIAFLLLGGVWADRLSRKKILISTDLVRFISQSATAVLLITGHADVVTLSALQAVAGAGQGFFRPASSGIVPSTVPNKYLQQANALLGISENGMTIAGAGIVGVLVATIGAGWAIAVDALTFGISALLLLWLEVNEASGQPVHSFLTDLLTGWNEFRSRRWLVSMVAQFSLFHLVVWAPLFILGPLISERELGGPSSWAAIMTMYSIGTLVGGGLGMRFQADRPLVLVSLLFIPQIVPLIALASTTQIIVLGAATMISGIANGYMGAIWETTLQTNVPSESLSRVSSYDWFASMIFLPVGYSVVGPVNSLIGVDTTLIVGSALMVGAVLLTLTTFNRREIWDIRNSQHKLPNQTIVSK